MRYQWPRLASSLLLIVFCAFAAPVSARPEHPRASGLTVEKAVALLESWLTWFLPNGQEPEPAAQGDPNVQPTVDVIGGMEPGG